MDSPLAPPRGDGARTHPFRDVARDQCCDRGGAAVETTGSES